MDRWATHGNETLERDPWATCQNLENEKRLTETGMILIYEFDLGSHAFKKEQGFKSPVHHSKSPTLVKECLVHWARKQEGLQIRRVSFRRNSDPLSPLAGKYLAAVKACFVFGVCLELLGTGQNWEVQR